MVQTNDFQTLIRKKLAIETARLWIKEISTTSIHLFTREYNYVTLFKTFDRRMCVTLEQKNLLQKLLTKKIERELMLNSKFHLCQRQVPDRVLRECYEATGINFDVILPNTQTITQIGNKKIELFVGDVRLFSKKISL